MAAEKHWVNHTEALNGHVWTFKEARNSRICSRTLYGPCSSNTKRLVCATLTGFTICLTTYLQFWYLWLAMCVCSSYLVLKCWKITLCRITFYCNTQIYFQGSRDQCQSADGCNLLVIIWHVSLRGTILSELLSSGLPGMRLNCFSIVSGPLRHHRKAVLL